MVKTLLISVAAFGLFFAANQGFAQQSSAAQEALPAGGPSYSDLADLAADTPLAAQVEVRQITAIDKKGAGGAAPGRRRVFIRARVLTLIRGDNGISKDIGFLYDAPVDSRGKLPKLKKSQALIFGRIVAGKPDQVQLVAPDAMVPSGSAVDATVRTIIAEALSNGAPPRITGIGDAFHVAGTIAGEGETQIFLKTANGDPVSLSVIRRPNVAPEWAVALGEVVDQAAAAPQRNSLLWYRFACFLPRALPARSLASLAPGDAQAAQADYAVVLKGLGPCGRTRAPVALAGAPAN